MIYYSKWFPAFPCMQAMGGVVGENEEIWQVRTRDGDWGVELMLEKERGELPDPSFSS